MPYRKELTVCPYEHVFDGPHVIRTWDCDDRCRSEFRRNQILFPFVKREPHRHQQCTCRVGWFCSNDNETVTDLDVETELRRIAQDYLNLAEIYRKWGRNADEIEQCYRSATEALQKAENHATHKT